MKNSIGSLAALAAFAAPAFATPLPPPVATNFNHVAVSLSNTSAIYFDIDNDNTADFYVFGNSNRLAVEGLGSTLFISSATFGTNFSIGGANTSFAQIPANTTIYYGFSFISGSTGQAHAAWVLFDANSSAPEVVGGGWQTISNQSVLVGSPAPAAAVPEPASYAALAGALVLTGALAQRRRRSAPPTA